MIQGDDLDACKTVDKKFQSSQELKQYEMEQEKNYRDGMTSIHAMTMMKILTMFTTNVTKVLDTLKIQSWFYDARKIKKDIVNKIADIENKWTKYIDQL